MIVRANVSWNLNLRNSVPVVMKNHVFHIKNSPFKKNTDIKYKPVDIAFASLLRQKFTTHKIAELEPDSNVLWVHLLWESILGKC